MAHKQKALLSHTWIYANLLLMFLLLPAHAFPRGTPSREPSHQTASAGHITILILDMSWSMIQNDPNAVRCTAAEAYIDMSGLNDQVGIIALTDGGEPIKQAPHAIAWQSPWPTDIPSQRQYLKNVIEQRPPGSPSCQNPFGNAPTYDALQQALNMLEQATAVNNIPASVILLSDGMPTPDSSTQVSDIDTKLIPKFQQHHWPVDTIALGTQDGLRPFLSNLARETGGVSYDDANGSVPGQDSVLNITPFFTDIFSQRVGGALSPVASLSSVQNNAHEYDFPTYSYSRELDIIIVKDDDVNASLISPPPGPFTLPSREPVSGTFDSINPAYDVFTIYGPHAGDWQLNVSGSGRYEVSSLTQSYLQIGFAPPLQNGQLEDLDRPFQIVASIVDSRSPENPLPFGGLNLAGTISYDGISPVGTEPFTQQFSLAAIPKQNLYQYVLTFPPGAASGTYTLVLTVVGKTSAIISEGTLTIHGEHFPVPSLDSKTAAATLTTIQSWAQILYSSNIPILSHFHSLIVPDASGSVSGRVQWEGTLYPGATISKALIASEYRTALQLNVVNKLHGQFLLIIPATLSAGKYTLTLALTGSFEGVSGDLGTIQLPLQVIIQDAPPSAYHLAIFIAVVASFGLLFMLFLLFLLCRSAIRLYLYVSGPTPFGECVNDTKSVTYSFKNVKRKWRLALVRHTVYSEEVYDLEPGPTRQPPLKKVPLEPGLVFRFNHQGCIKERRRRVSTRTWEGWDQQHNKWCKVPRWRYREFTKLRYIYGKAIGQSTNPNSYEYTVTPNPAAQHTTNPNMPNP